ncbi:lysophospholipid acyltransferase family protein [Mycoplasma buteonis]|uniref:lysophospholipid acyltransferase family protein n=1 Tax=Mycoplasma buteonis TaxID=171280 RepID=UPI00055F20C1|nr:lysophospholipid acyltransferase family protein [Mycoplasma buteonis]
MKKFAVNPNLKKVVFIFAWLHRFRKIWSLSRKYKKNPDQALLADRHEYMLKVSKKLLKLYNVDLEIVGFDNLPNNGGILLTPNHKSNMDPFCLIAALQKQTEAYGDTHKIPNFVAKEELNKKFIVRHGMRILDTFTIDRSKPREALRSVIEFGAFVKEQKTYGVIFPEGTRVSGEELGEFKAGAFVTAQKNYLSIIPVAISNSEQAFNSKRKGRLTVTVSFLKPIKASTLLNQEPKGVAEKVRKMIAEELKQYA